VTVEILIGSGSVLSRILDEDSAHRVRKFAESAGVWFRFNTQAAALEGTGRVESVTLDTGKAVGCDLVIIAKGVRPNTDLAIASRLDCDRGILVDRFMRTSDPNIYAAGDVAQVPHVLNGTPILAAIWPEAAAQGGCAGYNMAGGCAGYPGALPRNSLTLFGLQLASVGETRPATERHRSVHFGSGSGPVKRFVLEADRLVGAVALGDIRYVGVYRKMVQQGVRVRKAEALLKPLCGYGEKQTIKTNGGAV